MDVKNMINGFRKTMEERDMREYGRILTDDERDEINKKKEKEWEDEKKSIERKEIIERWYFEFVPRRYNESCFENFIIQNDMQRRLIDYLKKDKSVVVYGSNGTGKTHLAFAAGLYHSTQGQSCAYILAFDFFNEIKKAFTKGDPEAVIRKYAGYEYLIIDEVDKTHGTQNEFVYLYSLINKRYNSMKPTVMITNAKKEQLSETIGISTLDRIAGDGVIVEMVGENYRLKL